MKKIVVKVKQPLNLTHEQILIDLRKHNQQTSGKQRIIDVMSQLVDHTQQLIENSSSEERKKHQFRSSQFKKAMISLRSCPFEITSGKQATSLPGIGKGIGDRIDEILLTGTLNELSVKANIDETTQLINELTSVTGIGEANAKKFIAFGVTSLDDLIQKADDGLIKLTHHMQIGIKYYHDIQLKIPFEEVAELGQIMKRCISELHSDLLIEICGSHRRKCPLSGDIDVLMTNPKIVTDDDLILSKTHYLKEAVTELKRIGFLIDDLTTQGDTKYMGVCIHPQTRIGRRIDIRFVTYDSFFPALVYFTGSMTLNKMMRTIALEKGYTLNEYGLYKLVSGDKDTRIIVSSEKQIFDLLGIMYLEPPDREIK